MSCGTRLADFYQKARLESGCVHFKYIIVSRPRDIEVVWVGGLCLSFGNREVGL